MRYLAIAAFVAFVGAVGLAGAASAQQYEKTPDAPDCLSSDKRPSNPANTDGWWDRRTAEEQHYIRTLPCEERYIPTVCIFLFNPDLRACTIKGVAEKRANAACMAEGYELLTPEMANCEKKFISNFEPEF